MPLLQNEHARSSPSADLHAKHLAGVGSVRALSASGSKSLSALVVSRAPSPNGVGAREESARARVGLFLCASPSLKFLRHPALQLIKGQLWASTQREIRLFYGFTEFRGDQEEAGGW
jgi:hypothetical protein